jgi:hypothetical protein
VDKEAVIFATVSGGDHKRLAVGYEADVAQETLVEYAIRGFTIVNTAIGFADNPGPRCGRVRL